MTDLFTPMDLHGLKLPNRIWMSAMTRTRAQLDGVPTALMADYYAQRANAGLIVTECTAVSRQGRGVLGGPELWNDAHVVGWRRVTDAVHAAGGRIYCQLWHAGRVSHPDMLDGALPVAPSPLPAAGKFKFPDRDVDFPAPRELGSGEIQPIILDFARATRQAREAGFDGVELHAANGYLHDQFLQDVSNQRSDEWGGTVAKRARLILETVDAMASAWSMLYKEFSRAGLRLETRVIARTGPGARDYWMGAFVWNDDESDARFTPEGLQNARGTQHDVPSAKSCGTCHNGEPGRVLGFSALQQPEAPAELLLAPSPRRSQPPGDGTTRAALGYLHANCAHCHNPTGSAYPDTNMDLRLSTHDLTPEETSSYQTTLSTPLQFFKKGAQRWRVAPGEPEQSGVVFRMSERAPALRMPPLGTEEPDAAGVAAVSAWVASLR